MKPLSRQSDERILFAVRLRHEGVPCAVIADDLGMGRAGVIRDTNKIKEADLAESGDADHAVRRAYW